MMVYVALLRGINVGGKAKVEMPKLKATFEALGCEAVSTYINSGNVIFKDDRSVKQLSVLIEAAITKDFGLPVRVILCDLDAIGQLCEEIPASWTNDKQQKTDVLFLGHEIDSVDILDKVSIDPRLENVRYIAGALVWNIGRQHVRRGGGIKIIKSDIYPYLTIRNINTVRKLYALMNALKT